MIGNANRHFVAPVENMEQSEGQNGKLSTGSVLGSSKLLTASIGNLSKSMQKSTRIIDVNTKGIRYSEEPAAEERK